MDLYNEFIDKFRKRTVPDLKEKEIRRFECKDKSCVITVCEIEPGILINYPEGNLCVEIVEELFNFLKKYSENNNKKISLLIDNSNLKKVDKKAREYVVAFVKKASPIEMAVTFGSNILMANFISFFAAVMCRMNMIHRAFKRKEDAFNWIKTGK
jgi:hypothetical protein